jgi:TalC/MipB family fructose-6-phosphate aldolase
MEIWLAFSSFKEMEKAYDYPIKGILTNPTVIGALEMNWKEAVSRMNEIGDLPLGLQVVSTQRNEMIEEIYAFNRLINKKQLIIKLPFCPDALQVMPFIKKLGLEANMAAICTFTQAIVALESDIEYLSIYVGRISDGGGDGMQLIHQVKDYAHRCQKSTVIMAASIRNVKQLEEVAIAGADAAVITFDVLEEAMKSRLTDDAIEKFSTDWSKIARL